ncbi:MAG: DUF63 family protein, partial [Euryarchaeota archaeon]|nr:DUF63 family protein [Euryarchaeota archaeon]
MTGYTAADSLVLGAGVLALRRVLAELALRVSARFFAATMPVVLLGALSQTMSDAGRLGFSLSAPVVFAGTAAAALLLLVSGAAAERRAGVGYEWVSGGLGIAMLAYPAFVLLNSLRYPEAGVEVLILFAVATLAVLGALAAAGYQQPWGMLAVAGHMLDASSTVVGVERYGYVEELPLEGMLVSLAGTAYVIFPMKLLALAVAFWVVNRASAGEDRKFWYFVFFVLGFAPGVRNTLTLLMLG